MINKPSEMNEQIFKDLGKRLAKKRKQMKLTQALLAEQAGVSKRTIERIEAGFSIQMLNLLKVLRVFNLLGFFENSLSGKSNKKPTTSSPHHTPPVRTKTKHSKKSRSWGADS